MRENSRLRRELDNALDELTVKALNQHAEPRLAGSHHGTPDLFETDVKLLNDCMLWIQIARKSERSGYGPEWLPNTVDFLKSRLFWRIRSGKNPLKHAPPCAYSCPWYELIEDERPHWVWENVRIYQRGFRDNGSPASVSVAQTLYELIERQSDCSLLLAYGPYHFKVWAGQQMVPAHVDGKDVQKPLDGWYIQYLKNVELT